jgi:hypothetical protein
MRHALSAGASVQPRTRQQLVEPTLRVILHARDNVGEVSKRIDAARLAGSDERVEASDAHACRDVADEEVVLAAECDAAQRSLRRIVVERHAWVVEEAAELAPLVQRVSDRDRDRALRRMPWLLFEQPGVELFSNRSSAFSSEAQMLLRARDLVHLRVVIDAVDPQNEIDCLLGDRRRRYASRSPSWRSRAPRNAG